MKKDRKILLGIISLGLITRLFTLNFLQITDLSLNPLFISDILGHPIIFSWWVNMVLGVGNIILIWLISSKLFSKRVALLSSFVYIASPWTAYIELSGTPYIALLFFTLLLFLGTILNHQKNKYGFILMSLSSFLLLSSSIFYLVILPVFFITFNKGLQKSRGLQLVLVLSLSIILSVILTNKAAFINHFRSQLTIISDIGIVNSVNTFRGDVMKSELWFLGKIIENRYSYFSEKLVLNFLDQFSPTVYFTSQYKLLNFSFTPPIYLGFLLPFLFGFGQIFKSYQKYLRPAMLLLILTIPSVFSKGSPDLTRLIIFSPVVFIIIGLGLDNFYINKGNKIFKLLILITIILLSVQFLVTVSDIILREPMRLQKFT
ncbi:MAG: glycosyltransferase family 39 protein [Candidatus Daviesbacteria bacterium]|nr:glycosyltransferase family 39 protein [Candidatus Daviesbacteria bacterium]